MQQTHSLKIVLDMTWKYGDFRHIQYLISNWLLYSQDKPISKQLLSKNTTICRPQTIYFCGCSSIVNINTQVYIQIYESLIYKFDLFMFISVQFRVWLLLSYNNVRLLGQPTDFSQRLWFTIKFIYPLHFYFVVPLYWRGRCTTTYLPHNLWDDSIHLNK